MLLGKLDNYKQNNETRLLSYTPHTNINLKYLKVRFEIMKFLEENIRGKLLDVALGKDLSE